MRRSGVLLAAWVAIAGAIGFAAPVASAGTSSPVASGDSLTIAASPNPITFGGATTVSGALEGTSNANQPVFLQAQAAPFTGAFQDAGTTTTDASGHYSFKDLKPALNTKYRTATNTCPGGPVACCAIDAPACCAPGPAACCVPGPVAAHRSIACCVYPAASRTGAPIICPLDAIPCPVVAAAIPDPCSLGATSRELLVSVRIKVALHLAERTPPAGERVRFYGSATPAHDGQPVLIQRRRRDGHWRTVKTTLLADAGNELSSFSTKIRVRSAGTYRARVPHDSEHAGGTSKRKRVVSH